MRILIGFMLIVCASCKVAQTNTEDMLVRIAEIELYPQYVNDYRSILIEEAEASVRKEKGVIAIFPMVEKENANIVRIVEIYKNEQAYQEHLKTPHFSKYKSSTGNMIKSLRLVDMSVLDEQIMKKIFIKK